jgi:hypothetical protein
MKFNWNWDWEDIALCIIIVIGIGAVGTAVGFGIGFIPAIIVGLLLTGLYSESKKGKKKKK